MENEKPLLELKNVVKNYTTEAGVFPALKGIDLEIHTGEFLGIVGKSGVRFLQQFPWPIGGRRLDDLDHRTVFAEAALRPSTCWAVRTLISHPLTIAPAGSLQVRIEECDRPERTIAFALYCVR